MKKILLLTTLLAPALFGWAAPALADDYDLSGDARIKILTYNVNDVYRIATRYGYQTNIEFAPQEEIQTISVGDRSLWQLVPNGNRLFIRPLDSGATGTNMTVITNRRSYQFDLSEIGDKKGGVVYVARFRYPEQVKALPPQAAVAAAPVLPVTYAESRPSRGMAGVNTSSFAKTPPRGVNLNYTYTGSEALTPFTVYDDGRSTHIGWQDMTRPMPEVFVVGKDQREFPTSYYLKDGYLVFDSVAAEIVLKQDSNALRLYNESFASASSVNERR